MTTPAYYTHFALLTTFGETSDLRMASLEVFDSKTDQPLWFVRMAELRGGGLEWTAYDTSGAELATEVLPDGGCTRQTAETLWTERVQPLLTGPR